MPTPRLFAHRSNVRRRGTAIAAAVSLVILGAFLVPSPLSAAPSLSARLAAATRVAQVSGTGYWLVSADGRVAAFGGAHLYGSMAGERLTAPIVGIVPTPDGHGYWLVAKDGGVFSFGDAPFAGSLGSKRVISPVVGMASSSGSGSSAPSEPGLQGLIGPAGPVGATGPIGLAGSGGATGPQGPTGSAGALGATGANGARGATGPAGATGPVGSIVGSACTIGVAQGTVEQDVDSSTGVVTLTCVVPALVMSNALISGGWGIVTGSGLLPGTTLSECWSLRPGCSASGLVAPDGTINSAPNDALFACSEGITNAYFKGFTASGDPIESNHVDASC